MGLKTIRIFLDSNVILSGFISDRGAPRVLLDLLSLNLPFLKGLTGRYNIMEIERNLSRKLPKGLPVYKEYFPKLNLRIIPLPSLEEVNKYIGITAAKDVPVLVSAIKGKADFLITGDKDFSQIDWEGPPPFKVINPTDFLSLIPSLFY
jgi:putative PIN family toxin of toxin-antitoxin system